MTEVTKMKFVFTRKALALRIIKRLWDHSILSRRTISERGFYEVEVHVPAKYDEASIRALVQKLATA